MDLSHQTRFQLMCRQYRWLTIFMVVSVGLLLALLHVIFPLANALKTGSAIDPMDYVGRLISGVPVACYLFGVWSIGQAIGRIARGGPFLSDVARALRRIGIAFGIGGVFGVFIMINLLRWMNQANGFMFFDVSGMTLGMIGGALFLLGRVMDQAAAAQAELDEMI